MVQVIICSVVSPSSTHSGADCQRQSCLYFLAQVVAWLVIQYVMLFFLLCAHTAVWIMLRSFCSLFFLAHKVWCSVLCTVVSRLAHGGTNCPTCFSVFLHTQCSIVICSVCFSFLYSWQCGLSYVAFFLPSYIQYIL